MSNSCDNKLNVYDAAKTADIYGWSEMHLIALADISQLQYDKEELIKAYRDEIGKRVEKCPHI